MSDRPANSWSDARTDAPQARPGPGSGLPPESDGQGATRRSQADTAGDAKKTAAAEFAKAQGDLIRGGPGVQPLVQADRRDLTPVAEGTQDVGDLLAAVPNEAIQAIAKGAKAGGSVVGAISTRSLGERVELGARVGLDVGIGALASALGDESAGRMVVDPAIRDSIKAVGAYAKVVTDALHPKKPPEGDGQGPLTK